MDIFVRGWTLQEKRLVQKEEVAPRHPKGQGSAGIPCGIGIECAGVIDRECTKYVTKERQRRCF